MKFLDKNGLDIVLSAVKNYTDTKVANRTYKVSINGKERTLSSDTTAVDLGTYLTSQSLDSYYTKEGTDNAINNAIGNLVKFDVQVVTKLPETGVKGTIYLIADNHSDSNDKYDEYLWNDSAFEKIGNTDVDLSQYVNTVSKSGTGTYLTGVTKSGNSLTFTTGNVTHPNSFGKITVGSATVTSASSNDAFELKSGSNVSVSASGKAITIATSATADSAIQAGQTTDESTADSVYGALKKANLI